MGAGILQQVASRRGLASDLLKRTITALSLEGGLNQAAASYQACSTSAHQQIHLPNAWRSHAVRSSCAWEPNRSLATLAAGGDAQQPVRGFSTSTAAARSSAASPQPSSAKQAVQSEVSGTPAPASASPKQQQPVKPVDMEELMKVLIHPLPLGSTQHSSLNHAAMHINGVALPDPSRALQSVMRVLFVMQQVLKADGHIGVISPNPAFKPLVTEAALHCTNPNLWWSWYPKGPRTIHSGTLLMPKHQPIRQLLSSRNLKMVNPYCPPGSAAAGAGTHYSRGHPTLAEIDKWRLFSRKRSRGDTASPKEVLRNVVQAEGQAAKVPVPGSPMEPSFSRLQLLITLDVPSCQPLLEEASQCGVLTASVVDTHSDLGLITYPIYANGAHPAFVHFLLDWIVKVANMPPPSAAIDISK